jgi:hypothetical protein
MMSSKLFNVVLFTAGVAIGSAVTWKILKTKYEQIAQEEIDSVKTEYAGLMQKMKTKLQADVAYTGDEESDDESENTDSVNDSDTRSAKLEKIEYSKLVSEYRSSSDYSDDDDDDDDEEGGMGDSDEAPYINGPYVISPEDFRCSPPGYNAQALDYFADGILADSWGVEMDIEKTIGEDALDCFGEYADDIVYVRNDRLKIDYEVTNDPRTYAEATQIN